VHTFHDNPQDSGIVPKTQNEVQQMLKAAGYDPVVAFDHDYLENEISDTPPDPYWKTQGGPTSKSLTTPIDLVGKSGQTVSFNPPRTNVMSYYEPTADSIQKLSTGQIRVIYRRLYERGFHYQIFFWESQFGRADFGPWLDLENHFACHWASDR
jgi:hypothetical protein